MKLSIIVIFLSIEEPVHPFPRINGSIDIRYSVDPLKAVFSLRLIPSPQVILKSTVEVAWITEPATDPCQVENS